MTALMKGKVFSDRKHLLTYPVIAEVKYDEIRCHVHRVPGCGVHFLSYAGKPLLNMQHWEEQFYKYMQANNLHDLDCGIEVNGNFNDSYRWVRSKVTPPEKFDKASGKTFPALDTSMVKFILFDLPDLCTAPYSHRRHMAHLYQLRMLNEYGIPISTPEHWVCHSEEEVQQRFIEVRERGLEGLMVKTLMHLYKPGTRSDGWLKLKPEETFDGQIMGINRAYSIEGVPLDRAGSIDVRVLDTHIAYRLGTADFVSFASPSGIAHALGADMYQNPENYIGQWVEFKCMERDRQGGYRHPVFSRFREAK